jgi:hypothetical protein
MHEIVVVGLREVTQAILSQPIFNRDITVQTPNFFAIEQTSNRRIVIEERNLRLRPRNHNYTARSYLRFSH